MDATALFITARALTNWQLDTVTEINATLSAHRSLPTYLIAVGIKHGAVRILYPAIGVLFSSIFPDQATVWVFERFIWPHYSTVRILHSSIHVLNNAVRTLYRIFIGTDQASVGQRRCSVAVCNSAEGGKQVQEGNRVDVDIERWPLHRMPRSRYWLARLDGWFSCRQARFDGWLDGDCRLDRRPGGHPGLDGWFARYRRLASDRRLLRRWFYWRFGRWCPGHELF